MMMIIITRYPASEDRLIVRPLLSRVCALRLQPAEPQPYSTIGAAIIASLPDSSIRRSGSAAGSGLKAESFDTPRAASPAARGSPQVDVFVYYGEALDEQQREKLSTLGSVLTEMEALMAS